jgi:peptidoglycan/xylan/chitin deacetylase (PgdA/CDA1 family)
MRAILTYHSIDDSGSCISLDRHAFARHVRWLVSGRVQVTTVETLLTLPPESDAVAITFDDGFENFGQVAAPLLLAHGLPVTLFVVTDRVGSTNEWNRPSERGIPTLPLLGWTALARLSEAGVTLGSHTRTHPRLTRLDPKQLAAEVRGSAEDLKRETGIAPRIFAYPYGSCSHAVTASAASVFQWACTTDLRTVREVEDPMCLPRVDAFYLRETGRLEAWGSSRFNNRLRVRASLRRLRATLAPAEQYR